VTNKFEVPEISLQSGGGFSRPI